MYTMHRMYNYTVHVYKTCLICTGTLVKTCWSFWQSWLFAVRFSPSVDTSIVWPDGGEDIFIVSFIQSITTPPRSSRHTVALYPSVDTIKCISIHWYVRGFLCKLVDNFGSRIYFKSDFVRLWIHLILAVCGYTARKASSNNMGFEPGN